MEESILKKTWNQPVLRNQIPKLIENQKKQFYSLRDKMNEAWRKLIDMEKEYRELQAAEKENERRKV